jgi:membrane-bound ClpP family serine protease
MSKKKKKPEERPFDFPFARENYKLLIIGIAIIITGFILMIGGGSDDPNVFNPEIFSFRRITLAPLVALFGFIFIIYAIMKIPSESKQDNN